MGYETVSDPVAVNYHNGKVQGADIDGPAQTLTSRMHKLNVGPLVCETVAVDNHAQDGHIKIRGDIVQTLTAQMGTGGNNTPLVMQSVPAATDHPGEQCAETDGPAQTIAADALQENGSQVYVNPHHFSEFRLPEGPLDQLNAPTITNSDCKCPPAVMPEESPILRRITPLECARLQGFPDDWCQGLVETAPDDEEISFWRRVWNTWMDIEGKKHKTDSQIRKWLATEPADTAQYKMWGNGVALPCVEWILQRIAQVEADPDSIEPFDIEERGQISMF